MRKKLINCLHLNVAVAIPHILQILSEHVIIPNKTIKFYQNELTTLCDSSVVTLGRAKPS